MADLQVVVLALIQGVTEFFPVSSSAHLILGNLLFGWPDSGLFLEVAVHLGTLGAILVYFASDVRVLFRGFFDLCRGRITEARSFFLTLFVATIPLACVGFWADRWHLGALRTLEGLGWSGLFFGLLMYAADRLSRSQKVLRKVTPKQAFWGWGMAQTFALLHGASRSGVCITFGRLMGYKREDVARFSFLMAIPAISAAGLLKGIQFCRAGDWALLQPALLGMSVSFGMGLASLGLFMVWMRHFSLTVFALYRIILGLGLLFLAYR